MHKNSYQLVPFKPCDASVFVELSFCHGFWEIIYNISGFGQEIAWPRLKSKMLRKDNLWHSTCFELFVAPADSDGYLECNFAPNGDWAIYKFPRYRSQPVSSLVPKPEVMFSAAAAGRFGVRLNTEALFDLLACGNQLLVSTPVIVEAGGQQSFWSHRHRTDAPDFHDRLLYETITL